MPFNTWAPLTWNSYGTSSARVVSQLTGAVVPEAPIEGKYCLHVTVPAAGANFWDVGLQHTGHVFEAGKKYTLSLFLKSRQGTAQVNIKVELGQDPWTGYAMRSVTMTDEWAEYSITTPVFAFTVTPGQLTFHIGYATAEFWVDGVRFYEGDYVPRAYNPNPRDRGTYTETWASLSWDPGTIAVTHNVYFGDNFDDVNIGAVSAFYGNQAATSILVGLPGRPYPNGLVPGTTYYWRVDEVNDANAASPWKGDVWSFFIQPRTAYNPDPADGAESVVLDAKLSWSAGFGAKLHTVYFGENSDNVGSATGGGVLAGTTNYSPAAMKPGKAYYWRVDENDPHAMHKGQVWSFTTATDGIPALPSQTFYIAVDGSDEHPGSQTQPWRTVEHAAQRIHAGDTVVIMGGVYQVTGLYFGPAGSSFDQMTTYKSAPGERVIFCSADGSVPFASMADFVRVEGMWFDHCLVAPGNGPDSIGHGKEIVNCTIFRNDDGILIGSQEYLLVYGNRLIHTGLGFYMHGIYLSGGGPIGSRSNHVIVDNNIFIHGEGYAIHGWHGPRSMIVTRNFISRHNNGIVMDGNDHLIANNLVWECGPDGLGIFLAGYNIVVVNNIVRASPLFGWFGTDYLEHNAFLNAEPKGDSPILLALGNEEADFGVPANVIDETVTQLGEIFDQPVEILYQDQRIEPLFAKLRMAIPDGSRLNDAGRAWYDADRTVNIGPDTDQPACLNTLWYAFRKWGLKDWDRNLNVYEASPPWWGDVRTPDSRDNDLDGIVNDSDPDDDNDGLLDEYDADRDGDGVQDTEEIILAKDPDDKGSVPSVAPLLELSQDMIVVQSVFGRDPPAVTLSLRNGGVGTADWQVHSDAPWAEVGPISGSLGAGIESPLTVGFRTQTLPVGVYSTHVTFTCGLQTMPVPVQLEVLDESVIEEGLLHHWTFNEGEGNIAHDLIGGAHGTIHGAQWTNGITGQALRFDGIDDYVDIPESVNDFSQFTVALRFKTTAAGADWYDRGGFSDNTMWQRFITLGADNGEISLATAEGQLHGHFNLSKPGDARDLRSSVTPVNDNQWHHAAMTISAEHQVVLYLDGVQVASKSISEDAAAINQERGEDCIGRTIWVEPAWLFYSGAIDDVRIYDRALSPAETQAIYRKGD